MSSASLLFRRVNEKFKLRGNELEHEQTDAWSNRCVQKSVHQGSYSLIVIVSCTGISYLSPLTVERGVRWNTLGIGRSVLSVLVSLLTWRDRPEREKLWKLTSATDRHMAASGSSFGHWGTL